MLDRYELLCNIIASALAAGETWMVDKDFDYDVHCHVYPKAVDLLKRSQPGSDRRMLAIDILRTTCYGHRVDEDKIKLLEGEGHEEAH